MDTDQYRAALKALGYTQNEAARLFNVHEVTGRRWATEGPPEAVAMVLRIAINLRWTKEYLEEMSKTLLQPLG